MRVWFGRAVLLSFWIFSAWYLYIGGLLTKTLTFAESLAAIFAANSVFAVLFAFYAGTKKPKDQLFQEAFGSSGARYGISLLPAVTQIGWYAIVVEIGGTAFAMFLGFAKGTPAFYVILFVYGLITMWFAVGGLKRMGKLSYASIPAMLAFLVWGAYAVFQKLGADGLGSYQPENQKGTNLLGGIQLLIASFISAAVTIPDFLHDLPSKRKIFLASFWGMVPAAILVGGMGAAFAINGKSYDVLATLQMMSGPMLVYMLLSVDNLCGAQAVYPVGTGLASVFPLRVFGRETWTIIGGFISVALAMIGIVGKLDSWLMILGTVFSPIIGVVLANQYIVKGDFSFKKFHLTAFNAWGCGCIFSLWVPEGIPILQSLMISFLYFAIFGKLHKWAKTAP